MARPFCADSWVAPTPYVARIGTMIHWRSPSPVLQTPSPPAGERDGVRGRGSWVGPTPFFARIGTVNRGGFVAQAFEPAGPGDFPVARSWSTGLESPVNPQAGKPAVQAGLWVASTTLMP